MNKFRVALWEEVILPHLPFAKIEAPCQKINCPLEDQCRLASLAATTHQELILHTFSIDNVEVIVC